MKQLRHLSLLILMMAAPVAAAINPGGVVNIASYAAAGLPGSEIAQGSMFAVFGSNLAPAGLVQVNVFPLPTTMNGVSIQVTVAGVTRDCYMIYTTPGQVAAILPSSVPVGTGTLTLRYAGNAFSHPITVVARAFGMFTKNQGGSGAAIVQNFITEVNQPVNGFTQATNPGGVVTLWGTGAGPVAGDEAAGPLPGNLLGSPGLNLEVWVGSVRATTVRYFGRSGCCSGVDQLVFDIPPGVTGCGVPVSVVVNGLPSNFGTIAIAQAGTICSDAGGLSASDMELLARDGARFGYLTLGKSRARIEAAGLEIEATGDFGAAAFYTYTASQYEAAAIDVYSMAPGSCLVNPLIGEDEEFEDPIQFQGLDAGEIRVTNSAGAQQTLDKDDTGVYTKLLAMSSSFPGIPSDPPFVLQGQHTFLGTGGTQVGAFNASIDIPSPTVWTNRDAITQIDRSAGVTVTWSGGNPASDWGYLVGTSFLRNTADRMVGGMFICKIPVAAGTFTVPPNVLLRLPPSASTSGIFHGTLQVGVHSNPAKFNAPGIDLGLITYTMVDQKTGIQFR